MFMIFDKNWTLFLDRDGVINKRNFDGYITNESDFEFLPLVLKALEKLSNVFGRIVVVTNQQGVGKNLMTQDDLNAIHQFMTQKIEENKGRVDAVFSATNLRKAEVDNRKPNINMALMAKEKFHEIDLKKSVMVGDTDSDIMFGKNVGMKTVLIKSKEITSEKADFEFNSLFEFAQFADGV